VSAYNYLNVKADAPWKTLGEFIAEAKKNGWPVCVAIVDYHGDLVYFERLDNTQLGSVSVAVDKARTAAKFKRSTKLAVLVHSRRPERIHPPGCHILELHRECVTGGKFRRSVCR
jgi:uncharacterized protein GlcG (DUF336 family)